jgi:ATP-dependent Clp protease ATP-binding subunit ClpC
MTTLRSEAELVTLRKLAHELAHKRRERATSVHLLAAIATRGGPARDLLRERRLDDEALLKASRSFDEDVPDAISRSVTAARELAKRAAAPEPGGMHLLLALLADRRCAAHRALESCGVDVGRLRTAALQLSLGVIASRRSSPPPPPEERRPPESASFRVRQPHTTGAPPPVAVSLFPPARQKPEPAAAAPTDAPKPATRTLSPATPVSTTPVPMTPVAAPTGWPSQMLSSSPPSPAASSMTDRAGTATPSADGGAGRRGSLRRSNVDRRTEASGSITLDRGRYPVLSSLGHNLTAAAAEGKLDAIIGREDEIEHVLDVLAKRHAPSACMIGPAGVGKTSIARGVAARLLADADAAGTTARLVVEVVPSELVAGTGARGSLAERLAAIRGEVRAGGGRVILFVDEVHELLGGGALDEATAEIKLALARGELTLLGATTPEEYRRTIEADPALARRFTAVEIEEPREEDAFLMLRRVADGLAMHHGVGYPDEAIAAAIGWSVRYLPGRALPDKAVSILDLAGARVRRRERASGSRESGSSLDPRGGSKDAGARSAAARRGRSGGRRGNAAHDARRGRAPEPADEPAVGLAEVAEVLSELVDIPVERLLETDRDRMLHLEQLLAERVVGHAPALARIATVLRRNAAGLRGRRPIGSFLLLGPTGVGKTETAKAIAAALFHSPDAMTRLDLSEYAESHAIARLVGAPPGYVGHEAGGQLTEAVRRRPYQVVLLDEIEKAHRDVLEAFLQVFDEGRLTDGRGRSVDFTNTVLVLTSNLGAREAADARVARAVGFSGGRTSPSTDARMVDAMIAATRAELPPELYNRLDEVLCFTPLARDDVAEIARRLLDGLGATLEMRGVRLEVEPAAIEALLAAGGFDVTLGARPMKRAIMRLIEAPLAEMILRGELEAGSVALVSVDEGRVVVDAVAPQGRRAAV